MTTPLPAIAPTSASVIPYTNFRIALATAILGSLGATFGWINWLAIESGDWKLFVTIVVGAVVGLALHWTQHYVRVASLERRGESTGHLHGWHLGAFLYAGGFAFLGLATEHLITEMVAEYLRPFLASLASLLPAGAIIGWSMNRGRKTDENPFAVLADGLFIGCSIGVVTGIIWTISFGTAPWIALLSWWGLIGIGTRALTGQERNAVKVGDPIAAVALVFAMTFALNQLPASDSSYNTLGPFKSMVLVVRSMAAEVQQSPGVPADSWIKAEQELAMTRGTVDTAPVRKTLPRVRTSVAGELPGATPIDVRRGMENLVKAWSDSTAPSTTTSTPSALSEFFHSEIFRSGLIIILFALGAGFAPRVERALRPIDYPNSETYRNDIVLTCFMSAMLVIACLVAHFGPKHPEAGKRVSESSLRTCGQYSMCTGRTVLGDPPGFSIRLEPGLLRTSLCLKLSSRLSSKALPYQNCSAPPFDERAS